MAGCHFTAPSFMASQTVTNALLEANPSGAHNKDGEGCMPLHYAALKAALVMSSLLRANPKAPVNKDDEGLLPLHHVCSKGAAEGSVLKAKQ